MPYPIVTPVLSVGGTFSSGDYVGTSGTAIEFTNCGKAYAAGGGGATGYITGAELIDGAVQSATAELWIFNSPVTPPTDNAAWSISDADAIKLVCVIPLSTYYASALNSVAAGEPSHVTRYKTASNSLSLYGCIVTRGTPVYANGDITVRLDLLPD